MPQIILLIPNNLIVARPNINGALPLAEIEELRLDVAQEWSGSVLVRKMSLSLSDGPRNSNVGVVPAHSSIVLAAVIIGNLVNHLDIVNESAEGMEEAWGHPKLPLIFCRQLD